MRSFKFFVLLGFLVSIPIAGFAGATIDFENETTGESVEGLGTVHPMLDIQSSPAGAVVIETFNDSPKAYGAPSPANTSNACLEDANGNRVYAGTGKTAKGFAYPQTANYQDWSYNFSFMPGYVPASFSIRIFDVGDFNPKEATEHDVVLTAYDSLMNPIDVDSISYTSDGLGNPRWSDPFGDLLYGAGDACDANFGEPGYFELTVGSATGISKVTLTSTGQDPKVGFDSITIVDCTRTIGYWKNHTWDDTVIYYGSSSITEDVGRSDPVDAKPGNGILWNATGKNFSMLFAQWIAAKLNCGGGNCGIDFIDRAEYFLNSYGVDQFNYSTEEFPDKGVKRSAAKLAAALDDFNNQFSCYEEPLLQ